MVKEETRGKGCRRVEKMAREAKTKKEGKRAGKSKQKEREKEKRDPNERGRKTTNEAETSKKAM